MTKKTELNRLRKLYWNLSLSGHLDYLNKYCDTLLDKNPILPEIDNLCDKVLNHFPRKEDGRKRNKALS